MAISQIKANSQSHCTDRRYLQVLSDPCVEICWHMLELPPIEHAELEL